MLQIFRERTQGLLAWGIVILIVAAFSLVGINNYNSRGFGGGSVAAKVDGRKITWKEVDGLAEKRRQYLAESNPKLLNQIDQKTLRMEATQYLVQQTALDIQTKRLGFLVSDKQLAKRIASEPTFQDNGKFSSEKYKQFLAKISEAESTFTENVKTDMLIDQLRSGLVASSFVFDSEVKGIMELFLQQRDFGYLIVPASRFSQNVQVKNEDIEKYYQQHQQLFIAPEKIKLAYVELTLEELAKSIKVTEENLQEYYKKHEALYTVPEEVEVSHILINAPRGSDAEKSGEAKAKIDDILAKIKLGEDFSVLAKKYSEDTITGVNGGKLGKIGHGQTVEEFDKAAFGLANPGDVTEVVQTEYGYHIIQLQKKYAAYVQPYESVHNLLTDNYRRELAESQFADKGEELANLAFEYPDSLQYTAEKMKLPIQETGLFAKNEGDGIASIPGVVASAFSTEMLKQDKNSDLIKVDDERYVVIRVKEHVPTRPLTLAEVTDKIKGILEREITQKQAEELGNALLAKLKDGNTPHAIAKEANLEWNMEKDVERNNSKLNPFIMRHAFALPKPEEKKPINVGFGLPTGDYAILSLQTVKANAKAKEEHIQEQFHKQLAMAFAQLEFQLYEMALIEKSKIKIEQ